MAGVIKIAELREGETGGIGFRGVALDFWKYKGFESVFAGSAECVAGETRLYLPLTGEHVPIRELCEKGIAPVVQTLYGAMQAEVPFVKGNAPLYRVTTQEGHSFVATGKHLILTVDGWRYVSALEVGTRVHASSPYLPGRSSERNPSQSSMGLNYTSDTSILFYAQVLSRVPLSRVSSIEFVRVDTFYDIHVPGAEHYLAEGLWHHNTGKTYCACTKLHAFLLKYAGAQGVMARQTYNSLVSSVLQTYKRVIGDSGAIKPYGGERPFWFDYPNGSRLWLAGLDNPGKALSSERDIIYINQLEEVEKEAYETLTTRVTGRGAVAPYTQMIADCNPGAPSHWILHRSALKVFHSRHEDNPTLFNDDGSVTAQGERTLSILDELTGVRYERLRLGKWVSAEGVIYEEWQPSVHVIPSFPIPDTWPRIWSVDFGFTNPFAWGDFAIDPDGRLYLTRQLYHTQTLVEDMARRMLDLTQLERTPYAVICDHDAEDRATLEKYLKRETRPAKKDVSSGIQNVKTRLKVLKDGKPRLFVFEDSLLQEDIDRQLEREHKPTCLQDEMDVYIWEKDSKGTLDKDRPLKKFDHMCDCLRYLVEELDGGEQVPQLAVSNYRQATPLLSHRRRNHTPFDMEM